MNDYSELKRLAEASRAANHDELGPDEAFQEALHPEVVMALIAELERYRQYGCGTCDGSGHLHRADGEYCGACTSCGAYELEQAKRERDQLKAENEALRLALELCADELEGQVIQCYHGIPVEDMHPVTRRAYDRDMSGVAEARAAMKKAVKDD